MTIQWKPGEKCFSGITWKLTTMKERRNAPRISESYMYIKKHQNKTIGSYILGVIWDWADCKEYFHNCMKTTTKSLFSRTLRTFCWNLFTFIWNDFMEKVLQFFGPLCVRISRHFCLLTSYAAWNQPSVALDCVYQIW